MAEFLCSRTPAPRSPSPKAPRAAKRVPFPTLSPGLGLSPVRHHHEWQEAGSFPVLRTVTGSPYLSLRPRQCSFSRKTIPPGVSPPRQALTSSRSLSPGQCPELGSPTPQPGCHRHRAELTWSELTTGAISSSVHVLGSTFVTPFISREMQHRPSRELSHGPTATGSGPRHGPGPLTQEPGPHPQLIPEPGLSHEDAE